METLAEVGMAIGAPLVYSDQLLSIIRRRDSEGFSTDVCGVLIIANISRIFFWCSERFEIPLLIQSILMIIMQLILLYICIKYRRPPTNHDPSNNNTNNDNNHEDENEEYQTSAFSPSTTLAPPPPPPIPPLSLPSSSSRSNNQYRGRERESEQPEIPPTIIRSPRLAPVTLHSQPTTPPLDASPTLSPDLNEDDEDSFSPTAPLNPFGPSLNSSSTSKSKSSKKPTEPQSKAKRFFYQIKTRLLPALKPKRGSFWRWKKFPTYLEFICLVILIQTILFLLLRHWNGYVQSVGFFALGLESTLPLPQFITNFQRKSLAGFRATVILGWALGDLFKTTYFFLRHNPLQFKICAVFQLSIDLAIGVQALIYRKNTIRDLKEIKAREEEEGGGIAGGGGGDGGEGGEERAKLIGGARKGRPGGVNVEEEIGLEREGLDADV